jgi:hypothetical protein
MGDWQRVISEDHVGLLDPRTPTIYAETPQDNPSFATVHCLIDEQTGSWIPETVYAFFDQETADLIMQVQISRHGGDDFVHWPHTKNGLYSIRSAYNLAKFFASRSKHGGGMYSSVADEEKDWKSIWKINAPSKIKIHLWSFAQDCLPTGEQLRRCQIPTNDACIFCGREQDVEHAHLHCQFTQEVRRLIKETLGVQIPGLSFNLQSTSSLTTYREQQSLKLPLE